jgi:(2Fe-2S) ferredoxin
MRSKGLPEYSIKGGICNEKDCMYICTVLCNTDGIWYCDKHAKEKVSKFLKTVVSLGYPV